MDEDSYLRTIAHQANEIRLLVEVVKQQANEVQTLRKRLAELEKLQTMLDNMPTPDAEPPPDGS